MGAYRKISKRFLNAALIVFALIYISCVGQNASHVAQDLKKSFSTTDNFQIKSGSLRKENKQVIFEGGVELEFGQIVKIISHKTIFHFSESDSVDLMAFFGNVKMLADDAKITSEKAFSNNIRSYIEFEGNVNVHTESGIFEYDRFKYYFEDKHRYIVPDIQALTS